MCEPTEMDLGLARHILDYNEVICYCIGLNHFDGLLLCPHDFRTQIAEILLAIQLERRTLKNLKDNNIFGK